MAAELDLGSRLMTHLETHIKDCEKELDDDAESIIQTSVMHTSARL